MWPLCGQLPLQCMSMFTGLLFFFLFVFSLLSKFWVLVCYWFYSERSSVAWHGQRCVRSDLSYVSVWLIREAICLNSSGRLFAFPQHSRPSWMGCSNTPSSPLDGMLVHSEHSLRGKRFCGVREQRLGRNCSAKNGSRPIFRAGKTPKFPFLVFLCSQTLRKRVVRRLFWTRCEICTTQWFFLSQRNNDHHIHNI